MRNSGCQVNSWASCEISVEVQCPSQGIELLGTVPSGALDTPIGVQRVPLANLATTAKRAAVNRLAGRIPPLPDAMLGAKQEATALHQLPISPIPGPRTVQFTVKERPVRAKSPVFGKVAPLTLAQILGIFANHDPAMRIRISPQPNLLPTVVVGVWRWWEWLCVHASRLRQHPWNTRHPTRHRQLG